MNCAWSDNLEQRITANPTSWLNKAQEVTYKEERESAAVITRDDIIDTMADQEYRICLLELGIDPLEMEV